mmetsp:Transcript_106565/g.217417  ORF Transcript_106565/g.217417 Transcript_106565/m.217417 type:complete len:81 (-) Transcript_106565:44-286(-)
MKRRQSKRQMGNPRTVEFSIVDIAIFGNCWQPMKRKQLKRQMGKQSKRQMGNRRTGNRRQMGKKGVVEKEIRKAKMVSCL